MAIKLNSAGRSFARAQIAAGDVNKSASWDFSAEDGNKLLGAGGDDWAEYGRHFLAINDAEEKGTKAYYEYPFAKGDTVYRKGLVAIRSRAAQNDADDVYDAAGSLIAAIDGNDKEDKSAAGGREQRFVSAAELRSYDPDGVTGGDEDQRDVGGYAAVFNSPTVIAGYFREQVAPGAFSSAINNCDVRALFNHDPNYVIGRNKAGTLKLSEDTRGLVWRATPPATSWARDLAVSIDRGDISGCSFSFVPTVEEWDYSGDMPMRTIRECELYDVSAVTYPAYDDTSVAMRSAAQQLVELHRPIVQPRGLSALDKARIAARKRQLDSLVRA